LGVRKARGGKIRRKKKPTPKKGFPRAGEKKKGEDIPSMLKGGVYHKGFDEMVGKGLLSGY